jgi:hypothetical protein
MTANAACEPLSTHERKHGCIALAHTTAGEGLENQLTAHVDGPGISEGHACTASCHCRLGSTSTVGLILLHSCAHTHNTALNHAHHTRKAVATHFKQFLFAGVGIGTSRFFGCVAATTDSAGYECSGV